MKATQLYKDRRALSENAFVEYSLWRVPAPVKGSNHDFKYSLALVVDGLCVLRFDNEAGKGDHCPIDGQEFPYPFESIPRLLADFNQRVKDWGER